MLAVTNPPSAAPANTPPQPRIGRSTVAANGRHVTQKYGVSAQYGGGQFKRRVVLYV